MGVDHRTKKTEEVEPDHCLIGAELVDYASDELTLGQADTDSGRVSANLEEGVEKIFEGIAFGGHEAVDKALNAIWLVQFVFDASGLVLEPTSPSVSGVLTYERKDLTMTRPTPMH